MTQSIFESIEKELDMEFFLDRESIPFKLTRGVNGMQLNIKTCPNPSCQDDRYRTYFGVDTGKGNCFVCGQGFGKVKFVNLHFGFDNWSATAREMEALLREQGWRPVRKAMVAVDETKLVLPVSEPLPLPDGSNLLYLEQRGFHAEIVKYFGLRWCEFGWWRFKEPDGSYATQVFDKRVIIPVYDLDGEIKTFQGRDVTGTSDRKYLFPKALPGTGRYLLNGQNAVATDHVVMGEGIFDVAAIKLAFDEVSDLRSVVPVGSFGKHLSYGDMNGDDQLGRFHALRSRGVKFVTIMWDGEEKALTAALSAAKLLTGIGLTVRVALLPYEKDPNEVTGEVVRKAFYAAERWTPALDVRWRLRNPYSKSQRVALGLSAV